MKTNQKGSLIIVQEVFPIYRKSLYDILSKSLKFKLLVTNDSLGDITVFEKLEYVLRKGVIKRFFSGKFYWQTELLNYNFKKNDVVVLPASPRNLTIIFLLILLRLKGIKVVLWGHYESATGNWVTYYIRMLLLKFSSGILFYTDLEALRYNKAHSKGKNTKKVLGLNNGLNIKEISNFRVLYEKNIKQRNLNILFIGRLTQKTKLELLLRAIATSKLKSEIKLHIIGDGELKDFFIKLSAQLKIEKNVIWHGTKTDEKQISEIMNNSALFVYPGNVGLSLIHCMSYSLPCLIHDNRKHHNPEADALLENDKAIYFREDDYIDLSIKMDKLLIDKDLRLNQSNINFKIVEHKYNVDEMAKKFIEVYESLEKRTGDN